MRSSRTSKPTQLSMVFSWVSAGLCLCWPFPFRCTAVLKHTIHWRLQTQQRQPRRWHENLVGREQYICPEAVTISKSAASSWHQGECMCKKQWLFVLSIFRLWSWFKAVAVVCSGWTARRALVGVPNCVRGWRQWTRSPPLKLCVAVRCSMAVWPSRSAKEVSIVHSKCRRIDCIYVHFLFFYHYYYKY